MTELDAKADLHRYLQDAREVLLWKLDGLSEYDIRRPLTPTGTNLLGIVKHVAGVELEYFGPVFGRPHGVALPWFAGDADANADMWATATRAGLTLSGCTGAPGSTPTRRSTCSRLTRPAGCHGGETTAT